MLFSLSFYQYSRNVDDEIGSARPDLVWSSSVSVYARVNHHCQIDSSVAFSALVANYVVAFHFLSGITTPSNQVGGRLQSHLNGFCKDLSEP